MPALKLSPAGLELEVPPGARLQDVLFEQGVEFPCGGRGRCKGCRVKVLNGHLPAGAEEKNLLTAAELEGGWRLACRHSVSADLELEIAQWEAAILSDQTVFAFTPRAGLGIAIDLGSTTIVAQLLDMRTGAVLAVQTALNAQSRHGGDVMSRVEFAMHGGQVKLQRLIRDQLGKMVARLLESASKTCSSRGDETHSSKKLEPPHAGYGGEELSRIVLVGNTVMHHLFCGVNVAPLAASPFQPESPGRRKFLPRDLGWDLPDVVLVEFLPCLGGFVGSDILAGIVATGLHESRELTALLDLGTNGEVVVGNSQQILCTSTAAGPAFEGARILAGDARGDRRHQRGARGGRFCHLPRHRRRRGARFVRERLGGRGCGGAGIGRDYPGGRLANRRELRLTDTVRLWPVDARELQLAKGAIAAGLNNSGRKSGATVGGLQRVHLAGAFGNYISRASARKSACCGCRRTALRPPATPRYSAQKWPCSATRKSGTRFARGCGTFRSTTRNHFKTSSRRKWDFNRRQWMAAETISCRAQAASVFKCDENACPYFNTFARTSLTNCGISKPDFAASAFSFSYCPISSPCHTRSIRRICRIAT